MAQGDYELVFYGELVEGVAIEQAQAHVAQLFKATSEQVARMFTGNRVVIRNKLDDETIQKYIIAMQKRGAVCHVEKMGQPGVSIDLAVAKSDEASQASSASSNENSSTQASSKTAQAALEPGSVQQKAGRVKMANPDALPVAGEKVDEILSKTHFELDPVGIRLSDEQQLEVPEFHELDDVTLAPVGSDLVDQKEELPVVLPDISHLKIDPE
jgi:hypothetical protein